MVFVSFFVWNAVGGKGKIWRSAAITSRGYGWLCPKSITHISP